MKQIYALLLFTFSIALSAQDGALDPSFANNGILVQPYFNDDAEIISMVLKDNHLYAAGFTHEDNEDMSIIKVDLNGDLDETFGEMGLLRFPLGSGFGRGTKLLEHPDGDLVCIGWDRYISKDQYVILKIDKDGNLDTNFAEAGIATGVWSNSSFAEEEMVDGLFLSDERLIVAGSSYNGQNRDFLVACFNADGTSCSDFGTDGYFTQTTTESSGSEYAYAIAADANDNLYVGGRVSISGEPNLYLIFKYDSGGNLDASFGDGGRIVFGTDDSETQSLRSMVIDNQGRLLVAGSTETNQTYFFLQRFDLNGNPDTGFGDNGSVIMTAVQDALINDVKVLSNDQIVAAGRTFGFATRLVTTRFNDDGVPDFIFGNNGTVTTLVESTFNGIRSIVTDDESAVYAGGYGYDGNEYKMVIAKYTNLDVSIADIPLSDENFKLSPNPAENSVYLELPLKADRIHIVNMLGQAFETVNYSSKQYNLNLESLTKGSYLIVAETSEGLMKSILVKE